MRRVCTRVEHRRVALPVAGELEDAGAFHEEGPLLGEEDGNRWLTSTWNASLSTWLKSGLTVASSVIVGRQSPLGADAEIAVGVGAPPSPGATRAGCA